MLAHPSRPGALFPNWDPAEDLRATLPTSENTGSVICHSTGYIPGLEGRLNPILDTHGGMYLYADNIAIRDGQQQPARFEVGVPFKLEDSNGVVMKVKVRLIRGRTARLEYVRPRSGDT